MNKMIFSKCCQPMLVTTAVLSLSLFMGGARAQTAQEQPLKWDIASLCKVVHPMEHSMGDRKYLTVWALPLPETDALVTMRNSGELRRDIDMLMQRGIVPVVHLGISWRKSPSPGLMALAKTLQEAGAPVQILIPNQFNFYAKATTWATNPNTGPGASEVKFPALPQHDTTEAAAYVYGLLQPLKDAGIKVETVFFDYEGQPHPWNGIYFAQSTPEIRKTYQDPSVLKTFNTFYGYTLNLRSELESQSMAQPVHQLFPDARVGNYWDIVSSEAVPFTGVGPAAPPVQLGKGMSMIMPALYAKNTILPNFFNSDWPVTQSRVDDIYFHHLLLTGSSANANKSGNLISYLYIGPSVRMSADPRFKDKDLSRPAFRELLWHLWLRGTDGMYVYSGGSPKTALSTLQSFQCMEDVRSVLDEMLAYRDFLDHGKPMNFSVPAMFSPDVVWSGLRLKDRYLIRATSLGPETQPVKIVLTPNKTVTLSAPPQGATYLVEQNGKKITKVNQGEAPVIGAE